MNYDLPISYLEVLRRYQRNVSGREYVKVTCILMLSKGCSAEFISECLGIDRSTIYRYWDLYKTSGLDSILENRQKGYWRQKKFPVKAVRKSNLLSWKNSQKYVKIWKKSQLFIMLMEFIPLAIRVRPPEQRRERTSRNPP